MMMILRSAALVAAALTLANCCMSGTGCSGPMAAAEPAAAAPATAAASPKVVMAAPQAGPAAADWDGRIATSETDTDMVMEPEIGTTSRKGGKRKGDSRVDVMSAQSSSGYRSGRMTYEEEQAADMADEARLKQKLTICRNCGPTQ